MLYYQSNKTDFLLSNFESHVNLPNEMSRKYNETRLFGYCLNSEDYFRNEAIDEDCFSALKKQNIDLSGVFLALNLNEHSAELVIDPLCQFNIFYYSDGTKFAVSSCLEALSKYVALKDINVTYLYDQIAYQSPMRGETILKDVFYIQFDDISYNQSSRKEFTFVDSHPLISINRPDYDKYDHFSFSDLKKLYAQRLNSRANVVANTFDKVSLQLTGGADSRLAVSSFSKFDNIECYVYGNGESQDRLIFEEIIKARNISPATNVRFIGQSLSTPYRIVKGLKDSNFLKLNNLNTYMNGPIPGDAKYCKITGYYGANISGGVALPPSDTSSNARLKNIPEHLFTYHDYVEEFSQRNNKLRPSAINDLFYINNRGKSHYAAHSIAENKNVASIDILYDFLNLLLVKKCPYSDWEIDKNAISIDLIYENDKALALFPYDNRAVPKYRLFEDIPLINCFDGYRFQSKKVKDFDVVRPQVEFENYGFLVKGSEFLSTQEMLNLSELNEIAKSYDGLSYLTQQADIQANIYLYFLLAQKFLQS
ncbi:hypothetical protein QWY77_03395 [Thalassotalea ponticola]|uniref:hypothetical protein n=1 Tax=Thalassotalea ponticola TaxID=1523392 RepID=UPI0025B56C9E|nr:hypothetical protein [Thalassotalea ponticola]MDN3651810.1 hypothetical protein [Thalassotalea ponticola]